MDTNFFILSFLENLIDLHIAWTKFDEMINHAHNLVMNSLTIGLINKL
jgi:hypothetical protein